MEDETYNIPSIDTVEQVYDPALLDNIRRILEMQVQVGKPQSYKIEVDGLQVVHRTTMIEIFDNYKSFIHPTSKKVTVTVYRGIKTPNCTKHIFVREQPQQELASLPVTKPATELPAYLNGITFESRMQEILDKRDLENENKWLKQKLEKRDEQIREAEEYMSRLQTGIDHLKNENASKQNIWVERLLKVAENPPDWIKLMILNNAKSPAKELAGTTEAETESLSESDQKYIGILRSMEEELEEKELHGIMIINDKLISEPNLIPQVAGLLEIQFPE